MAAFHVQEQSPMFQATRCRLALWYTAVTAVLLLLFASGVYLYVRDTLIDRIDDTLHHVVEVVARSLVITPDQNQVPHINIEASFRDNADTLDADHIDLEWFNSQGQLLWSTLEAPSKIPLQPSAGGKTVHITTQPSDVIRDSLALRQVTERIQVDSELLGYLRVSHPWFEVTKPIRQLVLELSLGIGLMVLSVAAIGWLLSGLAMAPVRESYDRLKQFTADASHELRNPLAMLQTNVQVALTEPEPNPDLQQQQLQVIERLTRRLGRLVDDLLFLVRQDSGIVPPRWQTCHLDELLIEVVEEQQAIAAEKDLTLSLEFNQSRLCSLYGNPRPASEQEGALLPPGQLPLPEDSFMLWGDRDQLIRLFTNLVSNAIHYTPSQGHVTVQLLTCRYHGWPSLQVQVSDTGVGIPADALPHLFDRFYRADPARVHQGGDTQPSTVTSAGSGLGLAIARAIVDNHQGQISVVSTLNKGTIFTVILPVERRAGN